MLTLSAGELGKLLGTKWKELDEEEKKVGPMWSNSSVRDADFFLHSRTLSRLHETRNVPSGKKRSTMYVFASCTLSGPS